MLFFIFNMLFGAVAAPGTSAEGNIAQKMQEQWRKSQWKKNRGKTGDGIQLIFNDPTINPIQGGIAVEIFRFDKGDGDLGAGLLQNDLVGSIITREVSINEGPQMNVPYRLFMPYSQKPKAVILDIYGGGIERNYYFKPEDLPKADVMNKNPFPESSLFRRLVEEYGYAVITLRLGDLLDPPKQEILAGDPEFGHEKVLVYAGQYDYTEESIALLRSQVIDFADRVSGFEAIAGLPIFVMGVSFGGKHAIGLSFFNQEMISGFVGVRPASYYWGVLEKYHGKLNPVTSPIERIDEIQKPLLLIAGTDDEITPKEHVTRVYKKLSDIDRQNLMDFYEKGDDLSIKKGLLQIKILEGVAHGYPQDEEKRTEMLETIDDFIYEVVSKGKVGRREYFDSMRTYEKYKEAG